MAEVEAPEPRCGFDVCIPTPGVPMPEKLCGKVSAMKDLCMPNFLGPVRARKRSEMYPALHTLRHTSCRAHSSAD